MKKLKRLIAGLLIFTPAAAFAQIIPAPHNVGGAANDGNSYNGYLLNQPALAYSNTYAMDLSKYDASKVSAQVIMSSVNFTSPTMTDGSESTASVRVISVTGLSSATATGQVTIVSTNSLGGAQIRLNNSVLVNGTDWFTGATKQLTAVSLAAALSKVLNITASAAGGIAYATATYGSYANAYAFTSNNTSATVSGATLTGGADNAVLTIGGKTFTQGTDWQVGATTTTAVLALGNAIAASTLHLSTVASGNLGVIYTTSTLNGTAYNYTLTSSTPTALSVSQAVYTGGTNPGLTLGSKNFYSVGTNSLSLGLPVLWAIGANPAIGGLTTGTTYYVVPQSNAYFQLALYSTSAVAGIPASDFVSVTSTNSGTTAHTYTIAPLAWAGNSTFIWQASNDNVSWATAPSTGTVTFSSSSANLNSLVDFGSFNFRYLRFNFTAPTSGAALLQVPMNIKQDGIGRF